MCVCVVVRRLVTLEIRVLLFLILLRVLQTMRQYHQQRRRQQQQQQQQQQQHFALATRWLPDRAGQALKPHQANKNITLEISKSHCYNLELSKLEFSVEIWSTKGLQKVYFKCHISSLFRFHCVPFLQRPSAILLRRTSIFKRAQAAAFADEMKQYLLQLIKYTPRTFEIHSFVSM